MNVRSIFISAAWGALVLACSGQTDSGLEQPSDTDVSARPAAVVESQRSWPDVIIAERNLFIPEGVEYDRVNGRFLLGSLREGSVYQLEADGRLTAVVEDRELVSSVGIEVDEARGRLLVVNSDSSIFVSGGTGQAKLGVFDLASGKRIAMVDLAPAIADRTEETVFFANDVTVDDLGTIYVSDTRTGAIYRVDEAYQASLLHRFTPSKSFAPNGIVYHPSGYLLIAGGQSLYKLPLDDPSAAHPVVLPQPIPGADGMVWTAEGHLAIVANSADRVVVLRSSDEWSSAALVGVAPYEVMASTVAVVGDDLYVVHPHFRDDGFPSVERVKLD
jgi:sugar lactone lactonase YvrE